MANLICPTCGESNPGELENCLFCGNRLTPPPASNPSDSSPNATDENPEDKSSGLEKENPASENLFELGQAPTRKNTAELELSLPEWLRSLRKGQPLPAGESREEAGLKGEMPLGSQKIDPSEKHSDWLSGLSKVASEDEEALPEWLNSPINEKAGDSTPDNKQKPDPGLIAVESRLADSGNADWATGSGAGTSPGMEPQPAFGQSGLQAESEPFEDLDSLHPTASTNSASDQPAISQGEGVPGWLAEMPASPEENKPFSNQPENLPEWLDHLSDSPTDSKLSQGENTDPTGSALAPEWPSPPMPQRNAPEPGTETGLPDWLSTNEIKAVPEPQKPAPLPSHEPPIPNPPGKELPDWLAQLQGDLNAADALQAEKEQSEAAASSTESAKESEPLPDWLARLQPPTKPADGIQALIDNMAPAAQKEPGDSAYSMETPDWLAQLNARKVEEGTPAKGLEPSNPEDLVVPELPSWVQAMRPVESVVGEPKASPQEDARVTEQNGPLAGLQGVLPAGPGLGVLRKPPPYSTILQVSEGQQRYADALEGLISNETQPQVAMKGRVVSNRLWRWLIAALILLAVGFPLIFKFPATPPGNLQPPEMVTALALVNHLPSTSPNLPLLVVFDYEPALSGELEAAAAPLLERLLLQGSPLALISTSPTGPALAEHLLRDATASALVGGHPYVNLGYLAGGPSGVQYFAISPKSVTLFTLDGQSAWQTPLLGAIQRLSDFAALIILTDNADSGRVWLEQTGSAIGNTPILMVISAQVEPMIRPYYDSGQIKGLITGLAGGEVYDQAFSSKDGQASLANHYWSSFGTGILLVEILVIIGAFQSGLVARNKRRNKPGAES